MRPKGSAQLRRLQMRINGVAIPTRYDNETKSVIGEPREALPLGTNKAFCEVWLTSDKGVEMEWEFTRVPLPPRPPAPDQSQQETVTQLNRMRRAALLPDVAIQPALCLAAARHSRYLLANRLEPIHTEEPGRPEFYGKDHTERSERAGYFEPGFEVIAEGDSGPIAVQRLIDAPYHRSALLQPGAFDVGAGLAKDRITLLCALTTRQEVLVYPTDGQLDVPVSWEDTETPDPLRLYPGAERVTGYPITLHSFAEDEHLKLIEINLTGPESRSVLCYINTPDNDTELDNTIIIIPQKPLLPLSLYRARIVAKTAAGREITRVWQFTTTKTVPTKPTLPKPTPKPPTPPTKKKK